MSGMAWSGSWSVTHDLTAEEAADPFWRDLLDEASDGPLVPVGHDGHLIQPLIPGPIPVTVDDEHAQPVTGYLLRLPEEMGGGWVTYDGIAATFQFVRDIGAWAKAMQEDARDNRSFDGTARGHDYTDARWWAEAHRVALKAEQS